MHSRAEFVTKNGYMTKLFKNGLSKCPILNENIDSIVAIPFNKAKGLLMAYNRRRSGWEFPAGKIEAAERPEIALKRELAEECGLSHENLKNIFYWRSYVITKGTEKSEGIIYIVEIEDVENLIPVDIEEISEVEFKKSLPENLGFKDGFIEYVFEKFPEMWEEAQQTK